MFQCYACAIYFIRRIDFSRCAQHYKVAIWPSPGVLSVRLSRDMASVKIIVVRLCILRDFLGEKMVSDPHSGTDGDARLSLAMVKYLEGRMEASKISHKYNKVVRKRRKACRTLLNVLLPHGISSTFIVRGCSSFSPFLFSAPMFS